MSGAAPKGAGRALLLILDGAGYTTDPTGNAVTGETLPRLFAGMRERGFGVLGASADAVGLEPGQVGNSEAGHLTIGAGQALPSMTRRIDESFHDGSWARHAGWKPGIDTGVLHCVGLLSDAGVHAMLRTLVQATRLAVELGIPEVLVHPVLDGVDSRAGTAPRLLAELTAAIADLPGVRLGVVQGRKRFCDRSGDLEFTRPCAQALRGEVELAPFAGAALDAHLTQGSEMDFPAHLFEGGRPLRKGEPVVLTSHRADRMRQIARVLAADHPVATVADPGPEAGVHAVFFPITPSERGLAHLLKERGVPSVRIAEKCKFPHVTFFFNGFDAGLEGEGHCIPSIPEADIPAHPEMSAAEVTEEILAHLRAGERRLIVANIANLDQVGHLGRLDLARRAAGIVDEALERIAAAASEHGYTLIVTADHGNADQVEDEEGKPFGSHTERPVPMYVQPAPGWDVEWLSTEGSLANVAATCLQALGEEPPEWMQASLVRLEPSTA